MPDPHKLVNDSVLIVKVRVEPRSSCSRVIGFYGDALKVKLTASPVEGKANRQLVELFARSAGIPRRNVEILSGHASKNKTVRLRGIRDIDVLLESSRQRKR